MFPLKNLACKELKEGFHNKYNIENMTYQKWLSPK